MEPVTSVAIEAFLRRLGSQFAGPAGLYLLGGSALCLLGSPRETRDVDFTSETPLETEQEFHQIIADLSKEMHLDLEEVPIADFLPLPPMARERHRSVGCYGSVEVYIFDPYSIALSKIARGFESDMDDVAFMLRSGIIQFSELERHFQTILPRTAKFDIDPKEFRAYFGEIRRRESEQR